MKSEILTLHCMSNVLYYTIQEKQQKAEVLQEVLHLLMFVTQVPFDVDQLKLS